MASPAKVAKRAEKDDTVKLDVGGSLYTTKMSTLTRYPDSKLGDMFSGKPSVRDGPYVIDGDGPIFRHVLNFLRRGKLNLPEDFNEWDLLASEANFFQIQDLVAAVSSRKKELADDHKKEFVEFIEQDNKSCKYRGSWETFKQLPREFLKVFVADPSFAQSVQPMGSKRSNDSMHIIVEGCGEISGYWGTFSIEDILPYSNKVGVTKRPDQNSPNWMEVFQRTSELGFQLLNTSVVPGEKSWWFGKKVSP